MAFTPTAAKVWNLGEDLDEGLRLCYHKGPPEGRVLVHARRAGQARPHVEQNPLTRLHPPCNPMSENYMTLEKGCPAGAGRAFLCQLKQAVPCAYFYGNVLSPDNERSHT